LLKDVQYKIENTLQFLSTNCVEPLLHWATSLFDLT